MPHLVVRVAKSAGLIALFIIVAMLGILSGVLFAYAGDLPQVSALDNYAPSTITRVFASNGQVIGEFATQRRVVVAYDDINPLLREAIIATEDAEFDRHFGVNIWRIAVAAITDIIERRRDQGASTITQQVARNLDQFGLTKQKVFDRKIREAILAIEIEKRYTKKEIFTIYCNQMYLGHGAYGVEAASRLYFQKSNKQLNLEEAALIAGIFQTPGATEPVCRYEARDPAPQLVLQRMADEHYITRRRPRPPSRGRSSHADSRISRPALRRSSSRRSASISSASTARRCCTKRTVGVDDARLETAGHGEQGDRARAAPVRQAAWLPQAEAQRDRRRPHHRGFRDERWTRPIAAGDFIPAVVVAAPKTGRRACCRALSPRSSARRLCMDTAHVGCRSVQTGRPHRGSSHEARRGW